ncbi:MAG TPA: hypothetical protein VMU35_01705 [Methylomirabilota bacterium]|nr:hypothetical protein [Methylomirabilota bacterium]
MVKESELYPAVSDWLNSEGYAPIITGYLCKHLLSIPMFSLLPGKLNLYPDVIDLREPADLVAVEVKSDRRKILDALGQCFAYTAAADKVYLAVTEDLRKEIRSLTLLECLKIGLLNIRFGKRTDAEPQDRRSPDEPGINALEWFNRVQEESIDRRNQRQPPRWFVEEIVKPKLNDNVDYPGLHQELLRQTKAALGR